MQKVEKYPPLVAVPRATEHLECPELRLHRQKLVQLGRLGDERSSE